LIIFGLGYVLGTRAGRERYEQLRGAWDKMRQDPRVQQKAHQVADTARQRAPLVADKVTSAAGAAAGAARNKVNGSSDAGSDPLAGPQGTLP